MDRGSGMYIGEGGTMHEREVYGKIRLMPRGTISGV